MPSNEMCLREKECGSICYIVEPEHVGHYQHHHEMIRDELSPAGSGGFVRGFDVSDAASSLPVLRCCEGQPSFLDLKICPDGRQR